MRIAKGLLIVVGMSLALTGCAKSHSGTGIATAGKGTANATASPTAMNDAQLVKKFGDCMRANGVPNFEDPKINDGGGTQMVMPQGVGKDQADAAMAKCRQYLPNGGALGKPDPQMVEQARKFAQCMRDHGLPNFPDPSADGGMALDLSKIGVTGPDDPKLTTAQKACEHLLPVGPSGGAVTNHNSGSGQTNVNPGGNG
jgi:hypothetical protein